MHPQLLIGLLFGDLFILSHAFAVIVKPSGYQYAKSNVQVMCTDDFRKPIQPRWISPSGTIIEEFKPQEAICDDVEHCMDDIGEYCDNAFASCVAGRCVCQKFGIDPCTCLVSLGGCHMTRENKEAIAIATLINNDSLKYISCESKVSTSTEVHVIAMKYGIASPELTNVNVNISNRNTNTDKAVVLVLVSDRLVFWKVNIWHDQRVDQLVLLSRYQDEDNLIVRGRVDAIHKPKDAPYGIGDDAEYGGKTVEMLLYLEERYGQVTSFTSTYTADTWNITIDLAEDALRTDAEHSTAIFTENVLPWKTKLTIVGLENEDYYGTYTCSGKTSQSNVTILQKEQISVETPRRQNLTFREGGIIRCKVTGRPIPEVTWKVHGKPIKESSKYVILADGSLLVNYVTGSDAGEYICKGFQQETGDNQAKSIKVTILYEIPTAPLIWVFDEDIKYRSAIIHINSSNSLDVLPGFHYVLFVNGNNLNISGSKYNNELSLSIHINSLTPSTVYDVYGVAVSEGGISESSNNITFQTNDYESISVETPQRQNLTFRESGTIRCKVTGRPKPEVTWKFNGKPIKESYKYVILADGSLRVNYVAGSDAGEYICKGFQRETGDNQTKSITVTILYESFETQRLIENTYFGIIICRLENFYSTVTWKKNGDSLPGWKCGYFFLYTYILIVSVDYSDAGTYICIGHKQSCFINVIVEKGQ